MFLWITRIWNLENRLIRMNWVNNFGYSIRSFNQSIFEEGFDLSVDKLLEQSGPSLNRTRIVIAQI